MTDEENYDPVRVQRTIEGAYRTVDDVFDEAYEKLDGWGTSRRTLERHKEDVEDAIEMVEGLPAAVHEGDDLVYEEDDLSTATWGLNGLEEIYRSIDIPSQAPAGQARTIRKVADTIRRLETTLENDVVIPARDYGDIELLEPEDQKSVKEA